MNLVKVISLEILIRKFLFLHGDRFGEIRRNEWEEEFASESELCSLCVGLCAPQLVAIGEAV